MLKVWGRKTSSNVQKVMWALAEIGEDAERIDIGGPFGKNNEPPYLAMNPNGRVPTLEEDGFTLWESNAIVRYLARLHGRGLLEPEDAKQCALANQWMDWCSTILAPAHQDAFVGLIRTPPEKRNDALIEASRKAMIAAMRILDAQLAKTAFLAGPGFSMGDMPAAIFTHRYWSLVPERPDLPHLVRWHSAVAARPGFQDHVQAVPLS